MSSHNKQDLQEQTAFIDPYSKAYLIKAWIDSVQEAEKPNYLPMQSTFIHHDSLAEDEWFEDHERSLSQMAEDEERLMAEANERSVLESAGIEFYELEELWNQHALCMQEGGEEQEEALPNTPEQFDDLYDEPVGDDLMG